jgi:acetyl-CoA carboxylase biotin carboxylase subunit
VYAADRPAAISRMRRALDEYFIGGIKTNLPLFRRILEHPDFVAARIDTGFLDRLLATKADVSRETQAMAQIAAVSAALFAAMASQKNNQNGGSATVINNQPEVSYWQRTARAEGVRGE